MSRDAVIVVVRQPQPPMSAKPEAQAARLDVQAVTRQFWTVRIQAQQGKPAQAQAPSPRQLAETFSRKQLN